MSRSGRSSGSRSPSSTRSTSGRLSALPWPPSPAHARERPREVRRLLALRRRVPGGLHPGRRRGEHGREPRLRRRALRAHLRDQHEPLHLLRLLRARVPVRRDHARERVRDRGVLARRPHLHEGHAPRRADQARAGRRSGPLRHARAGVQDDRADGAHGTHRHRGCKAAAVRILREQSPHSRSLLCAM